MSTPDAPFVIPRLPDGESVYKDYPVVGSRWIIEPADLRRFMLDNLNRIDLRKVEKFAFVQLIANGRLSP
jgi:hypothetical protein